LRASAFRLICSVDFSCGADLLLTVTLLPPEIEEYFRGVVLKFGLGAFLHLSPQSKNGQPYGLFFFIGVSTAALTQARLGG